eukprot:Partr_v1_DN22909_c0_g1_i1_m42620 putative ribosomal protein L24
MAWPVPKNRQTLADWLNRIQGLPPLSRSRLNSSPVGLSNSWKTNYYSWHNTMKLEICAFSGQKIYPGRGRLYVRVDSRSFRFINGKTESLFLQRKNPRKIHWTVVFRKMHKKGITEEVSKKRTRKAVKHTRAIAGITLEKIQERKTQKPEEREAARKAAIAKAKETKKVEVAKKRAERSKTQSTAASKQQKGTGKVRVGGKR